MKQNSIAEAFLEKVEDPVAPKIYRLIRGNQLKFTEARSDILTHQLTRTCDGEFTCPWWNQDGDLRCQENAGFHFPKCDIIQKWCRWTSWFSGEIPSIEPSTVHMISFELLATGSTGSSHFQFDFLSGWHFPWFPQPPDCCDQTTSARKKYVPYIVSFVQEDTLTAVDFFSQLWSAAILVFIGASRVCNLHPNLRHHATHCVRRSPTCLNQSAGSWGINVLIQELAGKSAEKLHIWWHHREVGKS